MVLPLAFASTANAIPLPWFRLPEYYRRTGRGELRKQNVCCNLDAFTVGVESQRAVPMHTYEIEVYRDGRWWMIDVPEIDQLTQARHAGEIELMAHELIAVSTGQSIDNIAVYVIEWRWRTGKMASGNRQNRGAKRRFSGRTNA
jgi:hypothetical protein